MRYRLLSAAAAGLFAYAPAMAQEPTGGAPEAGADIVLELGVGPLVRPAYEGADTYEIVPSPVIRLHYLNIPGLVEFGGGLDTGLSIGPSFGYVGERKASDYADLAGLRDLDATYELGLRLGYGWDFAPAYGAEVYGEARYAFGEAEGFVGEFGANAIYRPTEILTLKLGPTASLASSDYADTYFSVSPEESLATGGRLEAFEASGGFKSVGVNAETRLEFKPTWFLNGQAGYNRLVGDAADSPIAETGSRDQFFFGIGISKTFSLDLF
ncbi:MipA/OmpV family protein [Aureimonas frigidaquae]|uniref:Putative MltA-interacting MipA n=1 Tax=Aureimonas frigidaquae TaxID=424757 RepID=A0A0P0Z418_9HYPH|nr:MipA/OmpV family protein [Aureimonas frigidaquae]BAT28855.1 putative MltA-interacting MipA [Aureimonas frigidaquae]